MKKIVFCLMVSVAAASFARGQSAAPAPKSGVDKVTAEIGELHRQMREAVTRRDRAVLERLYADEFLLVHTTGGVDNKSEHIAKSLTVNAASPPSAPAQSQVHLDVFGDVAVRTARAQVGPDRFIWWTWVYVKRGGHWQVARQHGTALQPAPPEVKLEASVLDAYVGRYKYATSQTFAVSRQGSALVAQREGRPQVELLPESETRFHVPGGGATYTFHRGDKGQVSHVTVRRADGQEVRADKVE